MLRRAIFALSWFSVGYFGFMEFEHHREVLRRHREFVEHQRYWNDQFEAAFGPHHGFTLSQRDRFVADVERRSRAAR